MARMTSDASSEEMATTFTPLRRLQTPARGRNTAVRPAALRARPELAAW